jgi:hypothetical protein
MADRKKPGVAFWATVVVVGLALYILSFGPFSSVRPRMPGPIRGVAVFMYKPVTLFILNGPDWMIDPYLAYVGFWNREHANMYRLSRDNRRLIQQRR